MAWAPDYITTAQLKAYVRIPSTDTQDDVQLALAVTSASRAVDNATNRQFGLVASPEARYYTARYDACARRYVVKIDDVMIVTGMAVVADVNGEGDYSTTITAYDLKPANAATKSRPYTELWVRTSGVTAAIDLRDGVKVTARYGWSSVPDTVAQATLVQASRFFIRRDSPYGIAGSPEIGNELRLLERVDPDVALMLRSYYRWWGAR